jgi:hypothetical protein
LHCRCVATHIFRRPLSPPFSMMKCAPGRCLILPDHCGGTKCLSELQASVFVNGHVTIMLLFKVRCCTPHVCSVGTKCKCFSSSGLAWILHRQGQSELFYALFITRPVRCACRPGFIAAHLCTLMYCGTARLVFPAPPLQSAHGILSHLALCISIDRHPNTTAATPFCN